MKSRIAALAWLALPAAAWGQTAAPYAATVAADGVELRSGPGEGMEATGPLARGERVRVVSASGEDWVAVAPPLGQVSWVRTIALQEVPGGPRAGGGVRNAVVLADPATEIAVGRPGHGAPLSVRKHKVPDGTVVVVLGPAVVEAAGGGQISWTPIVPVDGEVRYLPRSAVQPAEGATQTTFRVTTPPPTPEAPAEPAAGGRVPAAAVPAAKASPAAGKPADWPSDPLWAKAEEAFRRGDYEGAERSYKQLAANMNMPGGDVELANLCFSRLHDVRTKQREAGQSPPRREPAGPAGDGDSGRWTVAGRVRPTGFTDPGAPRYSFLAVEGPTPHRVVAYLVEGQDIDLGRWREGVVELYGEKRPGTRAGDVPVLTVERVRRAERR